MQRKEKMSCDMKQPKKVMDPGFGLEPNRTIKKNPVLNIQLPAISPHDPIIQKSEYSLYSRELQNNVIVLLNWYNLTKKYQQIDKSSNSNQSINQSQAIQQEI
jgi:hypothetical protein